MALTEDQIKEAQAELARREKAEDDFHRSEYARRQAEAEEKFWARMLLKYPEVDKDTIYDIYGDLRDFYE